MFKDNGIPSVYKNNKQTAVFISIILILVAGYIFFFLSSYIMPSSLNSEETIFDEEVWFGKDNKRTVTLYSWDYCEQSETMEIKVKFFNGEFDGINNYVYDVKVKNGSNDKIEVEEIMSEQLLTVIQIHNVKKGFGHISLYFAPAANKYTITSDDVGTVELLEDSITKVNKIEVKSDKEYKMDRLNLVINRYTKRNKEIENYIKSKEKMILNIRKMNQELEEDKAYQTSEEIALSDGVINSNVNSINQLDYEISTLEIEKEQNSAEISTAKNIIKSLK